MLHRSDYETILKGFIDSCRARRFDPDETLKAFIALIDTLQLFNSFNLDKFIKRIKHYDKELSEALENYYG